MQLQQLTQGCEGGCFEFVFTLTTGGVCTLTSVGGAEPLGSLPIPVLFLRGVLGPVLGPAELRTEAMLLREMLGN